jgi:processive 1,2-diacylglycerol beta-glucosyltransferase
MKALILSISTGQGHHAVGHSLEGELKKRGIETSFIDAYEYASPALAKVISKGYLASTKYVPTIVASKVYDLTQRKNTPSSKASPVKWINYALARELQKYVTLFNPDIIISTHVLSAMLSEVIIGRERTGAVTCGIVTDFTAHPMWQNARSLDCIITPSVLLEYQMLKKGIKEEKLFALGIPLKPVFSEVPAVKAEARRKIGLDSEMHTILIMGGSMGHGKIAAAIQRIDRLKLPLQVIAVCGNNQRLFKRINGRKYKKTVKVYGWTDKVAELMDAADAIITKPGGITTSESLAKGLPIIMQDPIAGHEERNAEFLQNNGLAFYITKSFPAEEAVFSMFRNPKRLAAMKNMVEVFAKPNSTRDICDLLIKMSEGRK